MIIENKGTGQVLSIRTRIPGRFPDPIFMDKTASANESIFFIYEAEGGCFSIGTDFTILTMFPDGDAKSGYPVVLDTGRDPYQGYIGQIWKWLDNDKIQQVDMPLRDKILVLDVGIKIDGGNSLVIKEYNENEEPCTQCWKVTYIKRSSQKLN